MSTTKLTNGIHHDNDEKTVESKHEKSIKILQHTKPKINFFQTE